jgi:hypothetical protein
MTNETQRGEKTNKMKNKIKKGEKTRILSASGES